MKDQLQLKELKLMLLQQDKIVEEEILERSIKQRALSILSGIKLSKKIKNIEAGENLDENKINELNISDIFKLSLSDEKKLDAIVN